MQSVRIVRPSDWAGIDDPPWVLVTVPGGKQLGDQYRDRSDAQQAATEAGYRVVD